MAGGDIGYSQYNHSDQRDLPRSPPVFVVCKNWVTSNQNVEAEKGTKLRGGGLTCIMDLQLQCITVCRYLQTV